MPSITTWTRLEPHARDASMALSLQARVHDPLWLLTRQWQLGEFKGDNSGSPVRVELDAEITAISRYIAGRPEKEKAAADAKDYEIHTPLETLVEHERVASQEPVTNRQAAESGLHFLRMLGNLASKYKASYIRQYPMRSPPDDQRRGLDSAGLRFIELISGRIPNGLGLYLDAKRTVSEGTLPPEPVIDSADRNAVLQVLTAWLTWYEAFFSAPTGGCPWVSERMEYEFALAAHLQSSPTSEVVLVAPEYSGGHLDWPSFSVEPDPQRRLNTPRPGGAPHPATPVLPVPVRFRGMPAPRFWEFEDAHVNFGSVKAGPEDLAQLLLIEFALIYGNDFFVVPIDLDVGSICRTNSLQVTDSFGDVTRIAPSSESDGAGGPWRMYSLSRDRRSSVITKTPDFLFLPPVLGTSLHGVTLEEVLFLRDEMANMAWAVERTAEGPSGWPMNRFEVYQAERARKPVQGISDGPPNYRLATDVPDYWIPLLAARVSDSDRDIVLERPSNYAGARVLGHILAPDQTTPPMSLFINEEEVPRAGARVTRAYQYARWIDGSTHLWVGRRKQPGRGEGSSGVRFDVLESSK